MTALTFLRIVAIVSSLELALSVFVAFHWCDSVRIQDRVVVWSVIPSFLMLVSVLICGWFLQ